MSEQEVRASAEDLLDSSHWRPLRLMLDAMDQDIASLYDEEGITGLRTRFVGPLIQLSRHESMTIQELATAVEVTHSAMSQTAAAMRTAGFVDSAAGRDGRTRRADGGGDRPAGDLRADKAGGPWTAGHHRRR